MNSICVQNVTKIYELYDKPVDRLKEALSITRKNYHKDFYALKGINFNVEKGETVGIIGTNGSGKSTILKIITGVLSPSSGTIDINGKISALLELGAGFNMDYTGIENIYMNGTMMGYSKEEMDAKIPQILEFADIGDFVYQPVKTYSSGMFVRLAFATQIFSDPDILIVDEALSVGDIRFQQKCYRAMDAMMEGKTVILVTHDISAVTRFCKRVIWIEKGELKYDGEVTEGLKKYQEYLINQAIEDKDDIGKNDDSYGVEKEKLERADESIVVPRLSEEVKLFGNGAAKILNCGFINKENEQLENIEPGMDVRCVVDIEFYEDIANPILGIAVKDRLGNDVIGINTQTLNINLPMAVRKQRYIMEFRMPELNQGVYTVTIAVASGYQQDHIQLCWADDALIFRVLDRQYDIPGMIYLDKGTVDVFEMGE